MKQRPYSHSASRQASFTIPIGTADSFASYPINFTDPFSPSPNYSSSSGRAPPGPGHDFINMFPTPLFGPGSTPPERQTTPPPTVLAGLDSGPAPAPWPSRLPTPHENPPTFSIGPTPRFRPPPPPSWAVPVPTPQQPPSAPFPEPSVPRAVLVGQEAGIDPAMGLVDASKEKEKQKQNEMLWVTSSTPDGFKDKNVMREVRKAAMDDHLRKNPKHSTRPHANRAHEQRSGDRIHSVGSGISDDQEPSLTSNEWTLQAVYGGRSRRPPPPQSVLTQSTTHVLEDEDPPPALLPVRRVNPPQLEVENITTIPESILVQTQVVVPPGPEPGLGRSRSPGLSPSPPLRGSTPPIHQPQPPLSLPVSSPVSRCAFGGGDTGFEISDDVSLEDVSSKTLKVRMTQMQTLKPIKAGIEAREGVRGFKTAEGATARAGVEWTKEERARAEERQMARARAEEEMAAQEVTRKVRREWMREDSERENNSGKDDDVDELLHEWTTLYTV